LLIGASYLFRINLMPLLVERACAAPIPA
jgi:hypothetical protein